MAMITIDRTVDDETNMGIEFTRVYFSVEGLATVEEVELALAKEIDDMVNLKFDPLSGKGFCVTIDFQPSAGSIYATASA
ncbi:hypothetical protein [Chromobacterium amazonense]|uniref:hypothetical protein n=1 Tax=Chromobacterium amazonense TaxID=1382803 RepID=UPI003F792BE4